MPPLGYCMSCEAADFRVMIDYMAGLSDEKNFRRSFLASSVKAALFSGVGGFAVKGGAFAESVPWSNWSGGQTCQPAGRYDIGSEDQLSSC